MTRDYHKQNLFDLEPTALSACRRAQAGKPQGPPLGFLVAGSEFLVEEE